MPELRAWLALHIPDATDIGAILLDPNDPRDARVLWEIACQAEYGFDNYFLGDRDATEVYMLHHHSKILASVVATPLRNRLARDLASVPDVIEDCSASVLDWGDDDWDDGDDEDTGS